MHTQLLGRASWTALALALSATVASSALAAPLATVPQSKTKTKAELDTERRERERAAAAKTSQSRDAAEGAGEEIVVRGIKDSLAEARNTKRKADQIVDVINAEDVGKLPAQTIGDVVSYIPGIQVGRNEGEVDDIQLRGLGAVQTTINGAESFSSLDRNAFIQDLPADLIKSVEVYKTTTPSQIEGSGSGSININLRRPTDFKKGFSTFINAAGRYNNQSKKYFQNYTGIVNYRADTPLGPMGLLLNVTYNSNPFLESRTVADVLGTVQTRQVTGPQILPVPTVVPTQIYTQYNSGTRTTTAYSGSYQWRPTDQLSILLEGNYSAIRLRRTVHQLYVPVVTQANSVNSLPALSNIVLVPGTNRIKSVTASPVTQIGPILNQQDFTTDQYYGRFAVDYTSEIFDLSTQLNYNGASSPVNDTTIRNRFVNRPVYDIDFSSDKYQFQQVDIQFRNLDLLDPNQYRFFQFDQSQRVNKGSLLEGRVDLTLRPQSSLIDNFQFGIRIAHRTFDRQVRTRSLSGLSIPVDQMPEGYNQLSPIDAGFEGTGVENNARWLGYDRDAARANLPQLYRFLNTIETQRGVTTPAFGSDVGVLNRQDFFNGYEDVFAFYGQARYSFDLLVPIDGVVGARIVNTMLGLNAFDRITRRRVVNGVNQTVVEFEPNSSRRNGLDVNPSASMAIHFTPKMQLRLGYTSAINRPRAYDLTSYLNFSEATPGAADGGNPDLKPSRTTKYDASFEYYFGRAGIITIAPFYWKLDRLIGTFQELGFIEGFTDPFTINRPINAGAGYRRGFEIQGQTFFTFLPGILKNFGISGNFTYIESQLNYPRREGVLNLPVGNVPIPGTAPKSATVMGLFERGGLSGRLAYNWRDKFVTVIRNPLRNSDYILPVSWMEANINYRFTNGPLKNLAIGAQAQNIGGTARRIFYGFPDQPQQVIYMARTYGITARYNF